MTKQNNFKFNLKASPLRRLFCLILVSGVLFSALHLAVRKSVSAATKFSSVYTDTTKQCIGAEPVFTCKSYGDYKLILNIGGVFQNARIESTKDKEYSLSIAERQSVGWNPKVEWRMADGKPFAVIVRVDENDENAETPKKMGEKLMVMGLKGYEHISDSVDAKTPKANEKAREIADQGFSAGNQKNPSAKSFTTSGFYQGIGLSSKESGDYYGIDVYLTESDGQLFALVTTAEGDFRTPMLVEATQSGKDMRTVEFTLPNENGDQKLKGIISANALTLDAYQGKKFVLNRKCSNTASNITVGKESGDYGGTEIYITDAGGQWYALVTLAEGVLMRPVLISVEMKLKNSAPDTFEFTLPNDNSKRKFMAKMSKTGMTLTESGKSSVLKNKCYQ